MLIEAKQIRSMSEAGWVKYNVGSGDSDKLESTYIVQMDNFLLAPALCYHCECRPKDCQIFLLFFKRRLTYRFLYEFSQMH